MSGIIFAMHAVSLTFRFFFFFSRCLFAVLSCTRRGWGRHVAGGCPHRMGTGGCDGWLQCMLVTFLSPSSHMAYRHAMTHDSDNAMHTLHIRRLLIRECLGMVYSLFLLPLHLRCIGFILVHPLGFPWTVRPLKGRRVPDGRTLDGLTLMFTGCFPRLSYLR